MRTVPLAALLFLSAVSLQAAADDGPTYATGLQAALDPAGVRLTWDDTGGPYTILRDGVPLATVTEAIWVDYAPAAEGSYGVSVGRSPGTALVLSPLYSRIGANCDLVGVGVISNSPFVTVNLHEYCLPGVSSSGDLVQVHVPEPGNLPIAR